MQGGAHCMDTGIQHVHELRRVAETHAKAANRPNGHDTIDAQNALGKHG